MKGFMKLLTAVLLFSASSSVFASETNMLINKLAEKGVITYGEASEILSEGKEEARKELAAGKVSTIPQWIQNISMKGDLRLRQQNDWAASSNVQRSRERLRLRMGFETRSSDNIKAGFGFATGSEKTSSISALNTSGSILDSEPSSTNHTFANGFSKAMLMVDFAYLEYTPFSWLKVTGGKMKSGTHRWQSSDLLYDTDINPDGVAITAARDFGNASAFLTGSWLILNELNSTSANPDVYIVQPGVKYAISEMLNVKAAVAFEKFNVSNRNTGYYGTPAFDYVGYNPSLEVSVKELLGSYALALFTDMASNTDKQVTSNGNAGSYGLRFGSEKVAEFGTWQLVAMQRSIESNAWLSLLGDSDAYGGANNSKGVEAIVTIGLTKAASFSIDYYQMDRITGATASTPKSLLQFDVVYKF